VKIIPTFCAHSLLVDIRPLRQSAEFKRLWIGQSLSGMGSQMTRTVVAVQVYDITQSSLAVGGVGLAAAIPLTVAGLFGGGLIDSVDRRCLVLMTTLCMFAVSLLFVGQAFWNVGDVWLLYALVAIQSACIALDAPARRSFVARLLPVDLLPAASSLLQLSFQISLLAGPMVGGFLVAGFGLDVAYSIDTLTFLVALYVVLRLRPMPVLGHKSGIGISAVIEGVRYIAAHRVLRDVLIIDMCVMVLAMPRALIPEIADTRFGGGPELVGMLFAAPAMGGLFAALFSGPFTRLQRQGLAVVSSAIVWGLTNAMLGFAFDVWTALIVLALAGAADMIGGIFRATLLQVNTPDRFRGRVNSMASMIGSGGGHLGDLRAGTLGALTLVGASAAIGGLACVAGILAVMAFSPKLIAYRAQEQEAAHGLSIKCSDSV